MTSYDIGFGPMNGPGVDGVVAQVDASLSVPNLALSVDYVEDPVTGGTTATVTATWGIPIKGEDLGKTTANKVVEYWISDRQGTQANPDVSWTPEAKVTARTAVFRALPLGTLIDVRVRARTGGGQYGTYSQASLNTSQDIIPPPKPSAPLVVGALRGVAITWDGKDYTGAIQPNDFDRCEVEVSTESASAGYLVTMSFDRNGGTHTHQTTDLTAKQYWVRLRSFDYTGNASDYSDVGTSVALSFTAFLDAEGGDNAVKNSSFEDVSVPQVGVPAHWKKVGTFTSTRDSSASVHNAASQLLENATGDSYLKQVVPVLPATAYAVSAYLRRTSGTTFNDRTLTAIESNGTVHQASAYSAAAVGSFVRLTVLLTTTSVTGALELRLAAPVGGALRWDAVQVEAGTSPSPYAQRSAETDYGTIPTQDLDDLVLTSEMFSTGVVPNNAIRDGAITAAKTALAGLDPNSGSVRTNHILAGMIQTNAITSIKIDAEAVNTDKLAANAVTAAKILAGSVTTSKLTVGSIGDNMVRNNAFQDQSLTPGYVCDGWRAHSGTPYREVGSAISGAGSAYMVLGPGSSAVISDAFPVEAGRYYYLGAQMLGPGMVLRFVTGTTATVTDSSGSYTDTNYAVTDSTSSTDTPSYQGNPSTLQVLEGQALVPNGHRWGRVILYSTGSGNGYVSSVFCRKVNGSTMITNGGVYTDKVSARGISAGRITAGSISASISMQSPTITSGTINSGTITGTLIKGSAIVTGEYYEFRLAITEDQNTKDSLRWYGPGSFSNPYSSIKAEIRGRMGNVQQYGVYLNSHVQIGNSNSSIFQYGIRVAVGSGMAWENRVRAGSWSGTFNSSSTLYVPFSNGMQIAPTHVSVMFGSFVAVWAVSSITQYGFTINARRNDGTSMAGVSCNGTYYAEAFNVNPFAGWSAYSN